MPPGAVARTFLSLFLSQWGPEQKVPVSTGASRGSAVSLPPFPEGPSGAVWAREGTWGPQPLVTSGMEARCPSSLSWNSPCQRVSVRTVSHPVAGRRGRAGCSCRLAEARSSARSPRSRRHGVRGRGPGLCRRPGGQARLEHHTRADPRPRHPPSPPMRSVRWCWLVGCCSCSLAPHNDSGLWLSLSEGGRHESALKGPGGARLGWAGQGGGGRGSQALPRSTGERHVLPLGHGIGVAQVTVALFTLASACGLWRPPRSSVQC